MEEWRSIPGYEGYYKINSLGFVKSCARKLLRRGKFPFVSKEKILKYSKDKKGYCYVWLYKDNSKKRFPIHQLVAISFLNYTPKKYITVVDHINNIKDDNRLCNLQILSHRENIIKESKGLSKYPGVSFRKKENRWRAQIRIGNKRKHLGNFINEIDAANAYALALSDIQNKSLSNEG